MALPVNFQLIKICINQLNKSNSIFINLLNLKNKKKKILIKIVVYFICNYSGQLRIYLIVIISYTISTALSLKNPPSTTPT